MQLPDFAVVERRGRYYLLSDRFREGMDPLEMLRIANDLLTVATGIIGLGRLVRPEVVVLPHVVRWFGASRVTEIYHLDGLALESGTAGLPPRRRRVEFGAEDRPRVLRLALSSPTVATALAIRACSSLDWVGLYMIYEAIETDSGGQAELEAQKWASASELTRFRRTANALYRHAPGVFEPPARPMLFGDARDLMDRLLIAWIARKLRPPS